MSACGVGDGPPTTSTSVPMQQQTPMSAALSESDSPAASWRLLFVDRVFQLVGLVQPGMGVEARAAQLIADLMARTLHELLDHMRPACNGNGTIASGGAVNGKRLPDLAAAIHAVFPLHSANWLARHLSGGDGLHRLATLRKDRTPNGRNLLTVLAKLSPIVKEHLGKKADDKLTLQIMSLLDFIASDILKWTGNYVRNIQPAESTISVQNLTVALNADKNLLELTEAVYHHSDDGQSPGLSILNAIGLPAAFSVSRSTPLDAVQGSVGDGTQLSSQQQTYEQLAQDFLRAETAFRHELDLVVHVFRRRFEQALASQPGAKERLESVFGNIVELQELTGQVERVVKDAVEMSDTPCLGQGLAQIVEAREFHFYQTYMQLFGASIFDSIAHLLADPSLQTFLNSEDEALSGGSGGQPFRMAVKYVLPELLHRPLLHISKYSPALKALAGASRSSEDVAELEAAATQLGVIASWCESRVPASLRSTSLHSSQRNPGNQLSSIAKLQSIQKSIEGWSGNPIAYTCAELVREGALSQTRIVVGGHGAVAAAEQLIRRGPAERRAFLFDHLLVLCKPIKGRSNGQPAWKFKQSITIHKADLFDVPDEGDMQFAFRIVWRHTSAPARGGTIDGNAQQQSVTLMARSEDEKRQWMADVAALQTRSVMTRQLDGYLKEEERRLPVVTLSPAEYRFAAPDNDSITFEDYTSSSGVPVVKHATVLKLVERLTYHIYTDNDYVRTFLTTYRSFCTPAELLNLLIERYRVPEPSFDYTMKRHNQSGGPLAGRYDTVQSHGTSSSSSAFWEQALQRFRNKYQRPIQCKVLTVIRRWVKDHWYDFEADPVLLVDLQNFLHANEQSGKLTNQLKKFTVSVHTSIERKQREGSANGGGGGTSSQPTSPAIVGTSTTAAVVVSDLLTGDDHADMTPRTSVSAAATPSPSFQPSKPPVRSSRVEGMEYRTEIQIVWHTAIPGNIESYDLLTLHPLEIGRQVTLLHFDLYRVIKPIELVGAAWTKMDKAQRSPQILKLIEDSDMLTYWVARSIVETRSLEERVAMFARVLEVMCVFEQLNNFNGVVALYSALNLSPVHRLKACWERLDREKQLIYDRFKKLCNRHWTEMIARLKSINPPCVPFVGHYLSRIFFFEEGNPTFVNSGDADLNDAPLHQQHADWDVCGGGAGGSDGGVRLSRQRVSFMKCRRIAAVISDIQMYQKQPYHLHVDVTIRQFFESLNPLAGFSDKEALNDYLYEQSQRIVPKGEHVDRGENMKPIRSANVLKSPGIKPPKASTNAAAAAAAAALGTIAARRHAAAQPNMYTAELNGEAAWGDEGTGSERAWPDDSPTMMSPPPPSASSTTPNESHHVGGGSRNGNGGTMMTAAAAVGLTRVGVSISRIGPTLTSPTVQSPSAPASSKHQPRGNTQAAAGMDDHHYSSRPPPLTRPMTANPQEPPPRPPRTGTMPLSRRPTSTGTASHSATGGDSSNTTNAFVFPPPTSVLSSSQRAGPSVENEMNAPDAEAPSPPPAFTTTDEPSDLTSPPPLPPRPRPGQLQADRTGGTTPSVSLSVALPSSSSTAPTLHPRGAVMEPPPRPPKTGNAPPLPPRTYRARRDSHSPHD